MVEVVIGAILIIIVLLIVGLIFRKKVYDNVDRLEAWKLDIMNRNVTEELAKVKKLNLSGETQEKFEAWRDNWDTIVGKELPNLEEYMLDAEEAADKFRIGLAQENLRQVERVLQDIEVKIEEMLDELEDLLGSEKFVRNQMSELEPEIKKLKKQLLHNRSQFSLAESIFDQAITEMEAELSKAAQLTTEGNYIEAQQVMEDLKEEVETIEKKMSEFPDLYREAKKGIPAQIKSLARQLEELEEEGCRVKSFGFHSELKEFEEQLQQVVSQLNKAETDGNREVLDNVVQRLQDISEALEQEVKAKANVENMLPKQQDILQEIKRHIVASTDQIKELQQSYYIESSDLELMRNVEKKLAKAENDMEQMDKNLDNEDIKHIEIQEKLEELSQDLEKLNQEQEEFQLQIKDLRKDELEAKEDISALKQQLTKTSKKLEKSNIPGIPSYIINALEEAAGKSDLVLTQLDKHPLDINKIQQAIEDTRKSVNYFTDQTNLLLDQARLVELTIQYGNRYRRSHKELAQQLNEAEKLFRQYKYEAALETAVKALEQVDDNAMKKIEELDKNIQHLAN
ncbi:septation ring formation regulator EzrA [Gracilibacillus alcaliphilus]|uniref:septation ring formation regulator EzrA n=1 Tax=Gracilibacillus alcaliphilus TaxID=1401441 RepID=UPI00195E4B44|nr:septation ring formation regulator EzrA [Gracilibacillus alcaliphilus]MBM7676875.1 septation ring formation regulator [Gracilibacillus alcaliphilus]